MTTHDHDDRALIQLIQGAWAPPPTDRGTFEAALRGRLRSQRRRRAAAAVACTSAVLLLLASHLLGGPADPSSPPALAPAVAVEAAEPGAVVASVPEPGVFWSEALDDSQRGFALPGAYGALDSLFLQPLDQEL